MKIAEEYPVFDTECPPSLASLGDAYNRLRADALALEFSREVLRERLGLGEADCLQGSIDIPETLDHLEP